MYTSTATRINEKWLIQNKHLRNIFDRYPPDKKFKNFEDIYSHNGMDNGLYQQCFLQVVTETVYNYPVTFFSEKTAKPILNKRPFVIVGPAGSLANLRSLGFKTFDKFWNENYDSIIDPEQRLTAVVDLIEWTCTLSIDDLQSLCVEMQDVLNYNFNYYVNDFRKKELNKLKQFCIDNLKPRYDKNKKSYR